MSTPLSAPGWRALQPSLLSAIKAWHTDTRLYTLAAPAQSSELAAQLLIESWVLVDEVSEPFTLYLHCLTLDVHVPLKQLYARPITLVTRLADGSEARRSGYVTEAISQESDGGFARKTLIVRPWVALLDHTLCSRTWQNKSVIDIVEDVFADHAGIAAWRWDDDVPAYVAQGLFARNGGQRAYCNQYRETDLAFVQRLLAEEGLCWRVEEHDEAPGGHRLVFFARSASQPQDATSEAGRGIRFHRSSSQEQTDAIQALGSVRQLGSTATVVQGWDYKANAAIVADVPTHHQWGGPEASSLQSWLTSYDPTGDFTFGNSAEAQFAATRLQEAREARLKTWLGRSTVRTLQPGRWMAVTQSTLDALAGLADVGQSAADREFLVTAVAAVGINNLPKELNEQIAQRLGVDLQTALQDTLSLIDQDTDGLIEQAQNSGHANLFKAIRRSVPWRAVLMDQTGLRPRPRPTALGPQTAIVVGPDGSTQPQGADELYTDQPGPRQSQVPLAGQPVCAPTRQQRPQLLAARHAAIGRRRHGPRAPAPHWPGSAGGLSGQRHRPTGGDCQPVQRPWPKRRAPHPRRPERRARDPRPGREHRPPPRQPAQPGGLRQWRQQPRLARRGPRRQPPKAHQARTTQPRSAASRARNLAAKATTSWSLTTPPSNCDCNCTARKTRPGCKWATCCTRPTTTGAASEAPALSCAPTPGAACAAPAA
jgi:type VI secretion system secreted protein VgrG